MFNRWIIVSVILFSIIYPAICSCYGTIGRCPAKISQLFQEGVVKDNLEPYKIIKNSSNHDCKEYCLYGTYCFMSAFNESSHQCSLYNKALYSVAKGTNIIITSLQCCDFNQCSVNYRNRCPGIFVRYQGIPPSNYSQHPPIQIPNVKKVIECYERCLSDINFKRICISLSFSSVTNFTCSINFPWDVNQLNLVPFKEFRKQTGMETAVWTCCKNDAIPAKTSTCRQSFNAASCYGRWRRKKYNDVVLSNSTNIMHAFKTLDIHICMNECERQAYCGERIWFNQTTSTCILECSKGFVKNACPENFNIDNEYLIGTLWEWECCKGEESSGLLMSGADKQTEVSSCLCVTNYSRVHLVKDYCGRPDTKNNYSDIVNGMAFKLTDKIFEEKSANKSILWQQLDNGFRYLWLSNNSINATERCQEKLCQLCNGNQRSDQKLTIIPRMSGWFANSIKYPERYVPYYNQKPSTIVINYSGGTFSPCYTLDCAAFYALYFQIYHWHGSFDCGPNFYINQDGLVLEDAGSSHTGRIRRCVSCSHKLQDLFSLQIIGNFTLTWPPKSIMETLKKFIEYAIKQNWINDGEYKLERWNQHNTSTLYIATASWPKTNYHIDATGRYDNSHQVCPLTWTKYFSFLCFIPVFIGLMCLALNRFRIIGHSAFCRYMFQLSYKRNATILQISAFNNDTSSFNQDSTLEYFEYNPPSQIFLLVDNEFEQSEQILKKLTQYASYYLNCLLYQQGGCLEINLRELYKTLNESEQLKCCSVITKIYIIFEDDNNIRSFSLIVSHIHDENREDKILKMLECRNCFCLFNVSRQETCRDSISNTGENLIRRDCEINAARKIDDLRRILIGQQYNIISASDFAFDNLQERDEQPLYDLVYVSGRRPLLNR